MPKIPTRANDRDAQFSVCGRYRYTLRRSWDKGPAVFFIMLNPSDADIDYNDPTIERCERRARQWGFGTLLVGNLFAFRATDPAEMKAAEDPVGLDNDSFLLNLASQADLIICGWGEHGTYRRRSVEVMRLLSSRGYWLHALKPNKSGEPAHPLYLPYSLTPTLFVKGDPDGITKTRENPDLPGLRQQPDKAASTGGRPLRLF